MPKARNKVVAGDYKGKLVGGNFGEAFISLTMTKFLYLNKDTVCSLTPLDDESQISAASAAMRGLVGELLLGPIGLVAAVTAKRTGSMLSESSSRTEREASSKWTTRSTKALSNLASNHIKRLA